MKKLLFLFLFAMVASIGTSFAERVQIGDLYYYLDASNMTASVTYDCYEGDCYRAERENYSELASVNIPSSVNYENNNYSVISIGWGAFSNCRSLQSVLIPNSVTAIQEEAFQGCSNLNSVTIPNSVTSIGNYAFRSCGGLTSVTIGNSVTRIGFSSFDYCYSLTSMSVASGNTIYDSRENCNAIIETATNTLLYGCRNTVIPSSVTSIGGGAFYNCSGLTSVNIPNSVTSIGGDAFYYCSSLTSITIPNSVTSIGGGAFSGCSLTSVTIPNSVTSIGNGAFSGCSGLKNVVFGTSLRIIEGGAFSNCPIDTIVCYSQRPPTVGNSAFDVPYSTIVFVPVDYLTSYQMHDFWGLYDVRPIEESAGGETVSVTITYQDKNGAALSNEVFTFHFPEAPEVEGFTFLGWRPVAEIIDGSITIQAVYESTASSYSPASVSVPGNPAQRLIREGNVYILRDGKTYTATGMKVE